ncbi:SRPBCC family protein [Nocardioides jiangxiensis]|uniref:SRPBCC family protein n=1 Tax=Nocardioides jiangxiensis TaxID=3064524 RepID=A0ABT9B2Z1_9ACTN|nr:SRPBCC family protein [Nocardioides sp. WY-20]MDO7869063.1 SRPBCC family protein [Nocardioides sp. WY-20]
MTESRLPTLPADRELRAETVVDAPVAAVWAALTDLRRMPEWSPELLAMTPLKRGGLRLGQWYLGWNRKGLAVWPSRSIVTQLDPERTLAWHTATSGATWIFELAAEGEGTRLVQRRPVPRLTWISRIYAPLMLGGGAAHADALEADMGVTLSRLKAAVERR